MLIQNVVRRSIGRVVGRMCTPTTSYRPATVAHEDWIQITVQHSRPLSMCAHVCAKNYASSGGRQRTTTSRTDEDESDLDDDDDDDELEVDDGMPKTHKIVEVCVGDIVDHILTVAGDGSNETDSQLLPTVDRFTFMRVFVPANTDGAIRVRVRVDRNMVVDDYRGVKTVL